MNTTDQNWQRLNDLLDERRDPLGDAQLREWLTEDEIALEEWSRLGFALRELGEFRPPARSWRDYALPFAAGLLGLFALQQFATTERDAPDLAGTSSELPVEAPSQAPVVFDFQLTIVTERPDERVTTTFDGDRLTREVERRAATSETTPLTLASKITTTRLK